MSTPTLITFILDRSGSMASCLDATIEAFNAYVDGLRGGDDGISFSLVQFDSMGIDMTWKNAPLSDVTGLNKQNYQPRGGTPLIDAAFKAIKATEKRAAEMSEAPKVVICIQTDGEENSSTQHSWDELNVLIKEKSDLGWQFNFMGVGIDAYRQAARLGIVAGRTMSYNQMDRVATHSAFAASASNTREWLSGARADTVYSMEQKLAAGDEHDPDLLNGLPNNQIAAAPVAVKPRGVKPNIVDDIEL